MEILHYGFEEDLVEATAADRQGRVRVYSLPDPVVVLGRGSKPEVELHVDACLEDGVPLYRRRGGGCSVVIDPGNVIVAAVEHRPGFGENRAHFERFSRWVIAGLDAVGMQGVAVEGTSDLALGDLKVGGSCIYRGRDVLLYSTTVLVSPEVGLSERYLAHPPREPDYRRGRSHRGFMGALRPGAGADAMTALRRDLASALGDAPPS